MQKVYNMFTGEKAGVILFEVTQEEVQMIKAVLNNQLSVLEEVRADYKYFATELATELPSDNREMKNQYWDKYSKLSKKINKLAALQAKIKRNF